MMTPRVVLVIEAEYGLRTALAGQLRQEGSLVLAMAHETMARDVIQENTFSLVIVDLHDQSTALLAFCQSMLAHHGPPPMPILAIVRQEDDLVAWERQGLHVTDSLLFPFSWDEFSACTQTLLRRKKRRVTPQPLRAARPPEPEESCEHTSLISSDDLVMNVACRTVLYQQRPLALTSALLFDLLAYFVSHPGMVVTRARLLEHVWRYSDTRTHVITTRTVDVHIHWLRELLGDDATHPCRIETIRGVGYRFKAPERASS